MKVWESEHPLGRRFAVPLTTRQPEAVVLISESLAKMKWQLFWDSGNADAFSTCKLAIKLGPDDFPVTYSLQTVDPDGWVTKQGCGPRWLGHEARPPIDTNGIFPVKMSAESPSNISPNP
jgi:hypothetical protein